MSMDVFSNPVVEAFIRVANKHSVPPKQVLMRPGDPAETLYLILEGSVSVMHEDNDGHEIVLAYLNAGDFFGEMCLFPEQKMRTAIVISRTPTLVAQIGYSAFRNFAHQHPEIMFVLAGQLAARVSDTSRRLSDLAFLDVAGRAARALLDLADQPQAKLTQRGTQVKISRQELARLIGCSREMAGRVLKRLEENGVITTQGRTILLQGLGVKPQAISARKASPGRG